MHGPFSFEMILIFFTGYISILHSVYSSHMSGVSWSGSTVPCTVPQAQCDDINEVKSPEI